MTIILPMTCIGKAKQCDKSKLTVIPPVYDMDSDYWWEVDETYRLPELGSPVHVRNASGVVVAINGINYEIDFKDDCNCHPWEAKGKTLTLRPTNKPLTVSEYPGYTRCGTNYFGQPRWVQTEFFPEDLRGNPCKHLMTIENGWGDSGNYNILLGFDDEGIPEIAYFEASCC